MHSISFYLLLSDLTYNHGKIVHKSMWGIFDPVSLSRFLEFKVRKDNCDPGV